ncbi:MAG: DUF2909 domain-containing protein [Gammaproteobacteria bacterium]|nr:DUF2909 domain-containing protein [Gammaproteobacteria bacterium]MBT8150218.1 DUF2909 domain-containing protein [Gammaproteobacteria bacterium]
MLIKAIILILLLGLIISLASGLVFLFKDLGTTRRTMHSLGVRITLAAALMATIVYGFWSGQLGVGAPWDARKYSGANQGDQQAGAEPRLEDVNENKQADPDNVNEVPVP